MTCVICKRGETAPGATTVTLHRGDVTIVVKGVPAAICTSCGEQYLDEPVASRVYGLVAHLHASSQRCIERRAVLIDYFASPSVEMLEMDAAWEEALALYGDEESDAWVAALEDGTHPLCRVRMPQRSA